MRTACFLLALVVTTSRAVSAQETPPVDQAEAEQKSREEYAFGEAAFKAGRYDEALTAFEAGFAIVPRPGFLLNIGHTQRKLGKLRNARSAYKKYLLMEPDSKFRANVLAVIAEIDSALAEEDRAERPVPPAANSLTPPPPTAPTSVVALGPTAPGPHSAWSGYLSRRPWFWIALGAVVVGAGGGLYLWQRPAGDGFQASGTLGSLRP